MKCFFNAADKVRISSVWYGFLRGVMVPIAFIASVSAVKYSDPKKFEKLLQWNYGIKIQSKKD